MVRKILNIAGKILMLVSIAYILVYLYNVDLDWTIVKNRKALVLLFCCGGLIVAVGVFIIGIVWSSLLRVLSEKSFDFKDSIKVYTKANLGKYLPGNVMHYVERNVFAAKVGIGQKETALSSILEIILEMVAVGLIAVFFIFDDLKLIMMQVVNFRWIMALFVILAIIIVTGCIVISHNSKVRNAFQHMLKKVNNKAFFKVAFFSVLAYAFISIIMGLLLFWILTEVLCCNLTMAQCGKIISTYILAWLIGFIVPGAPGGIGIREFVLITLLSSFIPEAEILFAIIFHRIITVVGDVLAYVSFYGVNARKYT